MACACKDKVKKVESLIPNIHGERIQKKGIKYYLQGLGNIFLTVLQRVIMVALVLIFILPISAIVLLKTIIWNKPLKVKIPKKLVKYIQQIDKNG